MGSGRRSWAFGLVWTPTWGPGTKDSGGSGTRVVLGGLGSPNPPAPSLSCVDSGFHCPLGWAKPPSFW